MSKDTEKKGDFAILPLGMPPGPYDAPPKYPGYSVTAPPQPPGTQPNVILGVPQYFVAKKWVLITVIGMNIIGMLGAITMLDKMVDMTLYYNPKYQIDNEEELEEYKTFLKKFLTGLLLTCILGELIFLVGIAKQNICVSTTYAVLTTLGSIMMAMGAIGNPNGWLNVILTAGLAYIAWGYVRDLRAIRDTRRRLGLEVV